MSIDQKLKALRKEARALNKKSKDAVRESGQAWLAMDEQALADFQRYCDIQIEIQELRLSLVSNP